MVLEIGDSGGGAFAPFVRPHSGAFRQLICSHPEEFAHFFLFLEMVMPRGMPEGEGWALLELTDT